MHQDLSVRAQKMKESATIAMAQLSRQMKREGKDVISLSVGEPDFNVSDSIKKAAQQAIEDNYSKYPPIPGYPELKEAISLKFKRDNQLDYAPNEIMVSTGAKQCIINVILALINEGDEVILPSPYWVSYIEQIKFAGGIPVCVESSVEDNFKISADQLEQHISSKTKLIIYSSPCNPSGSVYSNAELSAFASVIEKHDSLYILSDEIYEYINFTDAHFSIGSIPSMKSRTITVNGFAKGYAMTGWRLGYMGAPEWITNACSKIQGQFTSGANSIAQRAAIQALKDGRASTEHMKEAFLRRRGLMLKAFKAIPGVKCHEPQGAFYLFPDISAFFGKQYKEHEISSAGDLCLYLLKESLVACVSGEAFGNPNCIRISYASSDDVLVEACNRMTFALKQLK